MRDSLPPFHPLRLVHVHQYNLVYDRSCDSAVMTCYIHTQAALLKQGAVEWMRASGIDPSSTPPLEASHRTPLRRSNSFGTIRAQKQRPENVSTFASRQMRIGGARQVHRRTPA